MVPPERVRANSLCGANSGALRRAHRLTAYVTRARRAEHEDRGCPSVAAAAKGAGQQRSDSQTRAILVGLRGSARASGRQWASSEVYATALERRGVYVMDEAMTRDDGEYEERSFGR